MKIIELIDKAIAEKTKVFVNGMPSTRGGTILKREEDFIIFQMTNIDEKKPENSTKENVIIPISQINTFSRGEQKISSLNASVSSSC